MSTLKILSDINCTVRCDFKEVGNIQAGELYKLQLKKGCYILEFLVEDIVICSMDYTIETNDEEPLLRLNIKEQAEKKIMEQKFIRNKSTNVNIYLVDDRYILDCEANNPIVFPKGYDLYYKSIDGQYIEDEAGYLPFRITIVEERIENGETNKSEKTLYGSLNKLGEIIIKPIYNEPVIFYNSEIASTARDYYLIHLNHFGEEVALSYLNTEEFEIIAPLDKEDYLFIAKSTKDKSCLGVVRYDKKIIVSLSNKTIYKNTGDYIWALKGDTLSIYNNEGKWIRSIHSVDLGEIELLYGGKHQDYVFVHKDAVAVSVSGYWGLYDFEGNEIFPHIYEHLDAYWIDDKSGYHSGIYYGSSPLMFVKKRNGGYGIININVFDISDGIKDVNDIKEIIPCKYDAIYSNDGKQIINFNGNFFLYEEQDEKGKSYDVGVGDDILFVKYCDDFMECDYFCDYMLALSGENSKFKEEHFECKKFNQYYYIDVTGKYCLRKEFRDPNPYEKINLFKAYAGDNEFCAGYDREKVYTTIIEAINGNHRVIIINEYTLLDDWSGLVSGLIFPTSRFEIDFDFDEILGIKIEIEFKDVISLRVRKDNKVLNKVIKLTRKGRPTSYNRYDYPIIENLLVERTHDELVKQPHLFFDTETTGVPKDFKAPSSDTQNWPRLVQLAWILTDEESNRIHTGNVIVKPDGFVIPADATKVHGITTQRAKEEGVSLAEAIEQFKADLDVATYIVGHNIDFDKKIVGAEMIRLGMKDELEKKKSYCTMQSSIDFCKIPCKYGYKYPKLQELYKKLFGTEFDNAHDAMSDIEATEKCFWELRKRKLI